ncbi:MAG: DsrE/DsrF/DrsH-like family protein [Anaerolineae bacterium]|nr:DsrE/DsrF/DrsH-like family protein [Anaerolineae bacterium]
MSKSDPNAPKKLSMVASRGTLDWAYPPFIMASAAVAMGWEVEIFFTFYGLSLLTPDMGNATVTPMGNTAMPMKMPFGPEGFQKIDWPIPTAVMAVPGFDALATTLMKKTFKNKGVATLGELREITLDMGASLVGCQMTMEVFGFTKDDFIEGVEVGGAAAFLASAADADVNLFI